MRQLRFLAFTLIGLTSSLCALQEPLFAQSKQKTLNGNWSMKSDIFHAEPNKQTGCLAGNGGGPPLPPYPDFKIEQQGKSFTLKTKDRFGSWVTSKGRNGFGSGGNGEIDSLSVTFTANDTAGFTYEYAGTLNEKQDKITGKITCRHSSGSAIATGSFEWNRKDKTTKIVKVWLTGFIPNQAVLVLPSVCLKGDGRNFSNSLNEKRFRFRQVAEFEVEIQDDKITSFKNIPHKPVVSLSHIVVCLPGYENINGSGQSDDQPNLDYSLVQNKAIKVRFSGRLKHGIPFLVNVSPAIDYDIETVIDPIGEQKISLTGGRNNFPAYEMYMTFEKKGESPTNPITLLTFTPNIKDPFAPLGLIGGPDKSITNSPSNEGKRSGEFFGEEAGKNAANEVIRRQQNVIPSSSPKDPSPNLRPDFQ